MTVYTEQASYPVHKDLPSGPWHDEPDKLVWVDETTGLDCMIHRGPTGALCGYVGVGPLHPLHGVDYWECPVDCGNAGGCEHSLEDALDVHGRITYAAPCAEREDDGSGICHTPQPGRPTDVWWIGFDCAHAYDLSPMLGPIGLDCVYRRVDYVEAEVTSLAAQIAGGTR